MPLIPNLSLYLIQKFDRLALWGNLTILELHYAETQVYYFSGVFSLNRHFRERNMKEESEPENVYRSIVKDDFYGTCL